MEEEKDWSVVSDDVPIPVLGVELDCSPADIALRIRRPAFSSDGRKSSEHSRLLANLRKKRCLGVLCDVVRRRESSMRPPALAMHPTLRHDLATDERELLDQPDVLEQSRTAAAGCQNICVVRYGSTGGTGKAFGF